MKAVRGLRVTMPAREEPVAGPDAGGTVADDMRGNVVGEIFLVHHLKHGYRVSAAMSGYDRIMIPAPSPIIPPTGIIMDTLSVVRIAGALFFSAVSLPAQNLTATYLTVSPYEQLSGSFDGVTFNTKTAGVLNFDYADAFCVEPLQFVSGTVNYLIQPNSSLPNSESIAKVAGAYLASSRTSRDAAAAQWAIWEIVTDGLNSPSFRDGNLKIFFRSRGNQPVGSEETERKALEYISLSQLPGTPSASLLYATHPTSQNVVFLIPEPSGVFLGALGITSLLLRRRR